MSMMSNVIAFRARPVQSPLRRPGTLIRAARSGQDGWRRERDLKRLLHADACPPPGAALPRLRAEEEMLNAARIDGLAEYDLARHVMLMIAILAEMRAAVAALPVAVTAPIGLIDRGTAIPAHL